jgi:hypothetical protein
MFATVKSKPLARIIPSGLTRADGPEEDEPRLNADRRDWRGSDEEEEPGEEVTASRLAASDGDTRVPLPNEPTQTAEASAEQYIASHGADDEMPSAHECQRLAYAAAVARGLAGLASPGESNRRRCAQFTRWTFSSHDRTEGGRLWDQKEIGYQTNPAIQRKTHQRKGFGNVPRTTKWGRRGTAGARWPERPWRFGRSWEVPRTKPTPANSRQSSGSVFSRTMTAMRA